MTTLFTATDLAGLLGKDVTAGKATAVERVVWGWLKPILGWDDRPDEMPEELYAWALQLGAIVNENPSGLSAKDIGPFSEQYSEERRLGILEEVANSDLADTAAASVRQPMGDFPDAACYPDPAW